MVAALSRRRPGSLLQPDGWNVLGGSRYGALPVRELMRHVAQPVFPSAAWGREFRGYADFYSESPSSASLASVKSVQICRMGGKKLKFLKRRGGFSSSS